MRQITFHQREDAKMAKHFDLHNLWKAVQEGKRQFQQNLVYLKELKHQNFNFMYVFANNNFNVITCQP
jgi:pyridoxine 5'-phosphate synthase PdxJ